jgi:hypothetical protein
VFTRRFSDTMPVGYENVALALYFNGSGVVNWGIMSKGQDRILRIHSGWLEFVRHHCITVGATYVMRVGFSKQGWQLTVIQV